MAQTAKEMKDLSDQVLRIRDDLVAKAPKQASELLEIRDRINSLVDDFEQPKPKNHTKTRKSTTPIKTELGKKVEGARKNLGWSQDDLAKEARVSVVSLRKIESGETKSPHSGTVKKLENALGIALS